MSTTGLIGSWFVDGPEDVEHWEFKMDGAHLAIAFSVSARKLWLLRASPGGVRPLLVLPFSSPPSASTHIISSLQAAARNGLINLGEGHW